MYQRDTFGEFAAVNMDSIRKNRIICGLVSRHQRGALDDDSFFNEVVKRMTHYDGDLREEDIDF